MAIDSSSLVSCELFRGVEARSLERLAALASRVEVPAKTVLFRMGDPAEKLYVVARGKVTLALPFQLKSSEQDLTVDEKVPQELVGWSALVAPHRSTMTAQAQVDSELWVFPGEALRAALASEPATGMKVMANVAEALGRRFVQTQALWVRELQRGIKSQGV